MTLPPLSFAQRMAFARGLAELERYLATIAALEAAYQHEEE